MCAGRNYSPSHFEYWSTVFDDLFSRQSGSKIGSAGTLGSLRDMCGGAMRFKDISHLKPRALAGDYVDRIVYNGHALRKSTNAMILARMRSTTLSNGIILLSNGIKNCYFNVF
jgi:hypothetical protein